MQKRALLERVVLQFPSSRFPLRQDELDARLDREVVASQSRNGSESSVLSLGAPALIEARVFLALERLAAHGRREHAALAPAPDLLAGEILDHEIVGLPVGVADLQHLRRVVLDGESEAELVGVVFRSRYVERRDDWRGELGVAMLGAGNRFFVVTEGRSRGERD